MKILGYYCLGHDANICAWDSDSGDYQVLELERLFGIRHFHIDIKDRERFLSITKRCLETLRNAFGVENDFDLLCLPYPQYSSQVFPVEEIIRFRTVRYFHHQAAHAAVAHFQSPFSESLILSYHGGGDDGFFNVFLGTDKGVTEVYRSSLNLGNYSRISRAIYALRETRQPLSLPGKAMGLAGYGVPQKDWFSTIEALYRCESNSIAAKLTELLPEAVTEARSADLAATNQKVFESLLLEELDPILAQYSELPLCISGGCALNICANELLRIRFGRQMYVPPNPSDSGLATGYVFLANPPMFVSGARRCAPPAT
jgi:carbamoyltransferase